MVCRSDVLVENFRPGTMAKLGLDDTVLRKINPRLIYASCSGFGQTGPYSPRAAYDIIIQGMGGLMSLTGQPDGVPTRTGASIADITAGLYTTIAIITALYHREKTGRGQSIDIAMFDAVISILENAVARFMVTGEDPKPIGNRHPAITPFSSFCTADGYVLIAVGNDALWEKFCTVTGQMSLLEDERFANNQARTRHVVALEEQDQCQAAVGVHRSLAVPAGEAGIPCGPINSVSQLAVDAQVRARDMMVDLNQFEGRSLTVTGTPLKIVGNPRQHKEAGASTGRRPGVCFKDPSGYGAPGNESIAGKRSIRQSKPLLAMSSCWRKSGKR
jgi:CoA:oxalate CoA-transferase